MLEKVARAICWAENEGDETRWEGYVLAARAALDAIRDELTRAIGEPSN